MAAIQANTPAVRYVIHLMQAGMDGAVSARQAAGPMRSVWAPAAVGAALGAATGTWSNRRKSSYDIALGGVLGGMVGFGCAVAWASRSLTGTLARGAMRQINVVRDARWLEKNPIDYA